ncbi:pyrroline-5-carboxylate reductase [Marinicella gelatinilytica]|uniref:pyrroline-5-carboxylate reductase n=1 Tax=Marinicella gelatinilytica TaxID=2996017 RepID=UPI002260E0CA|nr:pyrroline-5-carboxylate reductase [Marinicella gelatinilytica]MCX7543907.1 pyrroline-5-carboxylate reductase [Marinicella gelatinilytica]
MKSIKDIQIRFIGAGNMAASLISGLLNKGLNNGHIKATNPNYNQREYIRNRFKIQVFDDNNEHFGWPDVVVMAVKPQVMKTALTEIRDNIHNSTPVVVSVAAGITTQQMQQWLQHPTAIVRTMPNTPAAIGQGAIGMFANEHVTKSQRLMCEQMMDAVGTSVWVTKETDMDIVTALSGSGPAYFFTFIKALQAAAEELGLSKENATLLTQQTAIGAALLAERSDLSMLELIDQVTSPQGTTHAALTQLRDLNFEDIVKQAVIAATKRSAELSSDSN